MTDRISKDKLLEALKQSIPKPDSVYLLKEGWVEHAGQYTIKGVVLSREQAQAWVDERGSEQFDGEPWTAEKGFGLYPNRKYERVRIIY